MFRLVVVDQSHVFKGYQTQNGKLTKVSGDSDILRLEDINQAWTEASKAKQGTDNIVLIEPEV